MHGPVLVPPNGLGLEPGQSDQMKRGPRRAGSRILNRKSFLIIAAFGLYTGGASLFLFEWLRPLGVELARTAAFTGMVIALRVPQCSTTHTP